jgi:Asp-tRNA(Asn)/Glu-tRNA(Gln) amidotransferase A subunit family amidase
VPTDLDEVDAPPTSVTLIAPAWHDELLVSVARRYAVAAAR